jgi:proteic killer suppression protein
LEVLFRSNKLEKWFTRSKEGIRALGPEVGKRYIQRINIIKLARGMDELLILPGLKCHPLKGDRAGQFAMALTGYFRLILTLDSEAPNTVWIEEVSGHYGD